MAFDIFGTNGDKSKQIQYKISNNVNRVIGIEDGWLEYTEMYIHAKAILQYFDLYCFGS